MLVQMQAICTFFVLLMLGGIMSKKKKDKKEKHKKNPKKHKKDKLKKECCEKYLRGKRCSNCPLG